MIIVNAEIAGRGARSLRVADGQIQEIRDVGGISRAQGEKVIDAAGGAVIPGLHDHHVHLRATAAARCSAVVGPPAVRTMGGFAAALRAAAAARPPSEWIRGVGYDDALIGKLDRDDLDGMVADHPVRVQHRSGALWVLNGRALDLIGADRHHADGLERDERGRLTGRVWRSDSWLGSVIPRPEADIERVSRDSARLGITGFTDAQPGRQTDDVADFVRLVTEGRFLQRLTLMAEPEVEPPPHSLVRIGPRKIVLDDDRLPSAKDLSARIDEAHRRGRPVAVHCVTVDQLVVLLASLEIAGARGGDRIEHGSVIPPTLRREIRKLGLTVITQPSFVARRGDEYLRLVEPQERAWLYPCGSLIRDGISCAAASDAPYGDLDPWATIRAAQSRRTREGRTLGGAERVDAATSLAMFWGRPDAPGVARAVKPGADADLLVLRVPLCEALRRPSADLVAVTIVAGRIVFGSEDE